MRPIAAISQPSVLITGGAGFIGTNLADRLAGNGCRVVIYDNFSRIGIEENAAWLKARHGDQVQIQQADIRDRTALAAAVSQVGQVFHLAAQVAVTTSIRDPIYDFEVNLGGTLNLLEAIRSQARPPSLIFTSTNKVYGALADLRLEKVAHRYQPVDVEFRLGIEETRPLEFHSPYGCSKGAADQYILDYCRTFGISAVVFRMSCIYGPHQMGTEDQGWIAHFLIQALKQEPVTICGDGFQVRDALFVDDLVNAFLLAQQNVGRLSGNAFNIGGGPENTLSLAELIQLIDFLKVPSLKKQMDGWRLGDQRYYVSNTSKFQAATGWTPRVGVSEGVARLYSWLLETQHLDADLAAEDNHAVLAH